MLYRYNTYRFGGWYTDEACTTEADFSKAINENQTVYAKWISNSGETPNDSTSEEPSKGCGNGCGGIIIGVSCGVVAIAGGCGGFLLWKKKGKENAKSENTEGDVQEKEN